MHPAPLNPSLHQISDDCATFIIMITFAVSTVDAFWLFYVCFFIVNNYILLLAKVVTELS